MTTETPAIDTKIAEYSPTAAALADLRQRMATVVYDVTTAKGLDVAKKDRAELRGLRTALEAKRVELKAPALEHTRLIDAEAKRLTAEIVALEAPIDAQVKAEEARREAEKQAKLEAERKRITAIQARIDDIRRSVADATGWTSVQIAERRNEMAATREDALWHVPFSEFGDEAKAARDSAVIGLADLQDRVAKQEAEAAQIEADRRELAELKRLQEEAAARDAEARKVEDARIRAERAAEEKRIANAIAAADAALRKERERVQAEDDARRALEDKRLANERAEITRQQAEIARQHEEIAAAERQRRQEQDEREAAARAVVAKEAAQRKAEADLMPTISTRPTDDEIVEHLSFGYGADRRTVIKWLRAIDFAALTAQVAA